MNLVKENIQKNSREEGSMGKKLLVLAGLMAALFMASTAWAQCQESGFTIQAVPNKACTTGETYVVDFIVTNNTGGDLSGLKIQGGTAAWVTPITGDGDCVTKVVEGDGSLYTPPPMNPKKSKKNQNQNQIFVYKPFTANNNIEG